MCVYNAGWREDASCMAGKDIHGNREYSCAWMPDGVFLPSESGRTGRFRENPAELAGGIEGRAMDPGHILSLDGLG